MPDKNPIFNPLQSGSIDPITGLTPTKSKKNPINTDALRVAGMATVMGPQDVGEYFPTESKYDTNITRSDLENLEYERALKQPIGAKAFNSIVGGLASGLMTAVQDVGYLVDLENNAKALVGLEELTDNWLTTLMRQGKEELDKTMPIHRQSNEVFDLDDPGFYFSAFKGIIDSAVGFGLPGLGATKAVGSLQKALKLTKLFRMSEPTAKVANSIASGFLTNFMEGKTMAVEQFENSIEAMKQNHLKSIFEKLQADKPDLPADQLYTMALDQSERELASGKLKEFEDIAGSEANKFMVKNMAFILTDAIGLHGLYKGEGFTRGLLKEKGLKSWAKSFGKINEENMILQGGKEYLEEVSQNVLQKEGEYQSAKRAGSNVSETPENLGQRVFDFAFSEQAQLEGLMGFFGGGPQRIMMEVMSGNFTPAAKKKYKEQYDSQQKLIEENTQFINSKLGEWSKWQEARNQAIKDGRTDLDEYMKDLALLNLAGRNFRNQTTENLINQLEDVAQGVSEDERLAKGWDENYQQQARDQIAEVKRLEKEFLRHTKYENADKTFLNRETKRILEKEVQMLKNELSKIDIDLNAQEVKDTDMVNRKKTFEKDLNIATERILQLEEDFKKITKPEYQKQLVKERKEKEKGIQEAIRYVVEKSKKEAADQKNKKDIDNINTKNNLSQEDIDDKNIPKEAFEKPEQIDDEEINTDVDQKDINPKQDKPDKDLTTFLNTEPVSDDEKNLAEELLQNLEIYIPVNTPELVGDEASNALVEGEDLSPEQRTLGILQNFIEAIKKSKNLEDITFDDLITRMLQIMPKERIAPSFMMLQDIFNFSQSAKQTGNIKRTNYGSLDEWSKLTPDEKNALNAHITLSRLLTIDQFTDEMRKELLNSLTQFEIETGKLNNEEITEEEYEYLKVEFAGNIIAYLSRNFEQTGNKRKEITNDLNANMQDKKILDPDLYKVGTEITLRVDDNPDLDDYVRGVEDKSKSKWGITKSRWKEQLDNKTITEEKYNELIRDNMPIAIFVGDQKIGYLHNVEWIKPSNVVVDGIQESIAVNRRIRDHVIANKEFTTKITKRTPGYLFRSHTGPVVTSEAFPDPDLTIAVVKNGSLNTKRKTTYPDDVVNKNLKEGCTYVIVPVGEDKIALPLFHNKIGENELVVKTIRRALEIFYNDTYSKNAQDKAFVDAIANEMRINITQAVGLSEFLRQFVNLYNIGDHDKADNPLQSFIKANTSIKQEGDVFFATKANDSKNDLSIQIGRGGMESSVRTLAKAAKAKISQQRFNKYLDEVMEMLKDAYFQTNLDNINTDKNLILLNENDEPKKVSYTEHLKNSTKSPFLSHNIADEGQPPKYVYTIQPVISFDYNGADESVKIRKVDIQHKEDSSLQNNIDLKKSQKYTLNRASTDKELAPLISSDMIDWEESFGDEDALENLKEGLGYIKSIRVLETRGRNNDGRLVGTIFVAGKDGNQTFEVFFKEPTKKETKENQIENVFESLVYGDAIKDIERRRQKELKDTEKKLKFASVGDILYDDEGNKYTVVSKKDKYGRSLEYTINDKKDIYSINPKTVSEHDSNTIFATRYMHTKPLSEINSKYDTEIQKVNDYNRTQVKANIEEKPKPATKILIPTLEVWRDEVIDVISKYLDQSYAGWGKTSAYPDISTLRQILEDDRVNTKKIPKDLLTKLAVQGMSITIGDNTPVEIEQTEQKPKPVYKKTGFNYNITDRSDYAESNDYLEETVIEDIEEKTEVTVDSKGNISGVRIKGFNAVRQQQVVDYIQKKITESVFENDRRIPLTDIFNTLKKKFENALQADKENLELANEAGDTENAEMFQRQIEYFDQILGNWNSLTALANDQLNRIKEIITVEHPDDPNNQDEGDEDGIIKGNEGWADLDCLKNPEGKLSERVKEMLSGITEYESDTPLTEEETAEDGTITTKIINPHGTPALTYFGAEKTLSFQEVYSTLQGLTANLRGDYESIIKALEKHKKIYPWIGEVIEKLEKSTRQERFAFTRGMTNHYVGMQFIMFDMDRESGAFKFTKQDSDSNEKSKKILKIWRNNLLLNSGARDITDKDKYIIPEELRNLIVAEFDVWEKNKKHPPEDVRAWLDGRFGITLNDLSWDAIVKGEFWTEGKRINYITFLGKIKNLLYTNVKNRGASTLSDDNQIIDGSFFKDLANLEARFSKIAFSNSHRSGKKTIYSYANNKFLVSRIRELKENSKDILGDLKKLSFNGKSAWLEAMHDGTEEENRKFLENFNYEILSLEPLKKRKAKSRDNSEMYRLSLAEIETVKLGFLQSRAKDRSGENQRIISLLYPSTSDKTTVMLLQTVAQDLKLDMEGNITDESVQKLIDYIVVPEARRILSYQKRDDQEKADVDSYKKGAANLFLFFPQLNNSKLLFDSKHNLYPDIFTNSEKSAFIKDEVKKHFNSLVEQKLRFWNRIGLGKVTEDDKTKVLGFDSSYLSGKSNEKHNPLFIVSEESKIKGAAADTVFQYLIGNAEVAKLFTGDPALYYKQSKINKKNNKKIGNDGYNYIADAKETYINLNKRLAGDIAPGVDLANSEQKTYTQAFAADFPAYSLVRHQITELLDGKEALEEVKKLEEKHKDDRNAFLKSIDKYLSSKYYSFDSTDAQEVTTWKEHLDVLWRSGSITDEEYTEIQNDLKKGKDLDDMKLSIMFQPIKPVYVDNVIDVKADIDRRVYIKSSSFPLLPQLTRNTQLDNLRKAMEDPKNGVDRLAYSTAVKVGNISNPVNIFDEQGNILPADKIDFKGKTLKLSRKGFRIQQDVPLGKITEINKVSQASKNLLINMLDVEGFVLSWHEDGKPMKGSELQKVYHEKYERLHKLYRDRFLKEIYIEGTTEINRKELRKVILREVKERNYPISHRELIELDNELSLLAFSPASDKFESLLNSLVNNRIIKIKMPGKSYVLGSEEGFKGIEIRSKEDIKKIRGIVYTKSYDPETGLKPARLENGEIKPSQAFVPWKFTDQKGHKIDIKQFMDENNMIDTSKIDPEILNLFGMRIPNQGPNSQGLIEIVGFLPEKSGDLIIATKDFVVQMGSDFDVDKLYTYMYETYVDSEGKIKVQRNKTHHEEEALKNEIIDIHLAIHRNADPKVQAQIKAPLGTWELERIGNDIFDMRSSREEDTADETFTGLSDDYQTRMFKEATMGKSGVSVFSLDSMFNAIAQGKDLILTTTEGKERVPVTIQIGEKISKGDLSDIYALDKKTYKSDIIAGYQSAAVDNVKLQILAKLNINNNTFKVIKLLNQLGFGEEVPYFIAQDIIMDYCEELERLGSSLTGYVSNKEEQAFKNILENPKYKVSDYKPEQHDKLGAEEATIENLKEYIKLGNKAINYRYAQIAILKKFRDFNDLGQTIQSVQTTINPDSAGIGKSVFESLIKEDKVFDLLNSDIVNAETLIGEIIPIKKGESEEKYKEYVIRTHKGNKYAIKPKTINGFAIAYGLITNNVLWEDFFPYRMQTMEAMFEEIELLTGADDNFIKSKAERRKEIWNEFKSFLFTKEELGLYQGSINEERKRLLYDVYETQVVEEGNKKISKKVHTYHSLASIISQLKNSPYGKLKILSLLEPDLMINGDPSLIKFNAASAEGKDEGVIYASLIEMLVKKDITGKSPVVGTFNGKEYTLTEIAQDLISYAYITGGIQQAIQFVKYVPAAYLYNIPFFSQLSNFRNLENEFSVIKPEDKEEAYNTIHPFVLQYFQHNPEKLPQLDSKDIVNPDSKDINEITSFTPGDDVKNKYGLVIGKDNVNPALITLKNNKSESRLSLFKYNWKEVKYERIDTLGSFGNTEYNYQAKVQTSLLNNNRTRKEPLKPIKTIQEQPVQKSETKPESLLDQVTSGHLRQIMKEKGIETTKEILNDIILTGTETHRILAQMFFEKIDYLPEGMKILVKRNGLNNPPGSFMYGFNEVTNEKGNVLFLNSDVLAGKDKNFIHNVFLHELVHAFTGYKIRMFKYENSKEEIDKRRLAAILKIVPQLALTDEDRVVIQSLDNLRNEILQKLQTDDILWAAYNKFLEENNKPPEQRKYEKGAVGKFYGLSELGEFTTQSLTSKPFQDFLNSIVLENNKTFFENFKELIVKLLKSLGFEIQKGSAFETALDRTIAVFELQKPQTETTSIVNIPQNRVSGQNQWGYTQEATNQIKELLGPNPTSIDMIEAGFRTRTTRSDDEMKKYKIKVGSTIRHFGKSADGTTKSILARVTAIHPKGTPGYEGTWNKEGWTQEGISDIRRFKDGAAAVEFELINNKEERVELQKPKNIISQKGINISSYESGLGNKLSNFANIPIKYNGKEYKSSEQAYQSEKKSLPDLSDQNVLDLMTEIIAAKLTQHPELANEIYRLGGIDFLNESTHNLIKNGTTIKSDRWTGKDGLFMQALREGYQLAQYDLTTLHDTEQEEQKVEKPTIKTEAKIFKEYGTYYRFEVNEEGNAISGMYSQADLGNWMPFKDNKKMIEVYERVKNIKESTPEKKSIQSEQITADNQLKLHDGKVITFNAEQFDALKNIREWLKNSEDQFFVLTGYAGTGKSTIVRKLIEENNKTRARKIGGATPTHRAKRVLSVLTGNDAKTLHSILGLGLNIDLEKFTLTKPEFDPMNPPTMGDYDLIIIDESSMINKNLFEYTFNLAKSTGTKLLFMGDSGQIPPVGEVASKVFTDERIKNRANLVKVERLTDGNPLNKVFDAIRSNLKSIKDLFAHKTELNERKEGIIFTNNRRNFVQKAIDVFTSEEFANDPMTSKVIAWTNERIAEYNQLIREKLIGANVDIVEVNDILMGYATVSKNKLENIIENSADYKVIKKSNKTQNDFGISGFYVTVVDTNDLQDYNTKSGFEKMTLEKKFFIVDHSNNENFKKYSDTAIRLLTDAKSTPLRSQERRMKFAKYYSFQKNNLSFKEVLYTNNGRSDVAMNRHIDYGYAITAHKSQGGTFKHVFVDEDNIDRNKTIQEKNQIKYVALSRASHTATVLSSKTEESNNSFVQPAQSKKVESIKTKSKSIDLEDEGIDMAQLMREMENLGDRELPGEDEELEFEGNLYPQEIVSDQQVDEFMKRCKS